MDIVEELRHDYCNCLDDYKLRGRTDPQCESCSTKAMRHEAASEIESLRQQLEEANGKVAEKVQQAFDRGLKAGKLKLLDAMKEARNALQLANDTPNGPINDTIWMPEGPCTLFDFMDMAIEEAEETK